ncbi:MAG: AAA family ATPase [Saprospiraceae bacterium]|nr:AAA family ATPase [Saprospiraceae bacterium]
MSLDTAEHLGEHYQYYGTPTKAGEVIAFISHMLDINLRQEAKGKRKTPICIWGKHGIGKTEIVQDLAQARAYQLAYIAPAQFEEMGDLLGMPSIHNEETVFKAPAWVPKTEGPGILLIDDVNRADDRILRGIMQLLQNHELVSWKLPPKWQIVLTANPDGGDYSVTPMDDAMLTRMLHITLVFDLLEWAKWAEKTEIDPRGIHFVLTHPNVLGGNRTTARTLVQFFDSIQEIPDLRAQLPLVKLLADSCLDEATAKAFITFAMQGFGQLPQPTDILSSIDFGGEIAPQIAKVVQQASLRVDILAAICTRLVNYLSLQAEPLNELATSNLRQFVELSFLPTDLRLSLLQDLVQSKNPHLATIAADPSIANLLLKGMG